MIFWRVGWKARAAAFKASLLPFALMLVLYSVEDVVHDLWYLQPPTSIRITISPNVGLDGLYFVLDGLFIGLLLEAMLSGRSLVNSMPPLLPPRRVLLFALAMLPLGLIGGALSWAAISGFAHYLTGLSPAELERLGEPLIRGLHLVVSSPMFPLIAIGLAIAPVAVRLLELPRIRDAKGSPPSGAPSPGLFGALVLAVLLNILLVHGLERALFSLLPLQMDVLATLLAWYVANFATLTLVSAAIAILLVRRAGLRKQ